MDELDVMNRDVNVRTRDAEDDDHFEDHNHNDPSNDLAKAVFIDGLALIGWLERSPYVLAREEDGALLERQDNTLTRARGRRGGVTPKPLGNI